MTNKNKNVKKKAKKDKTAIKCRKCFMVDGYADEEKTCRHCGEKIFLMDAV